jgi:hypothetical protein
LDYRANIVSTEIGMCCYSNWWRLSSYSFQSFCTYVSSCAFITNSTCLEFLPIPAPTIVDRIPVCVQVMKLFSYFSVLRCVFHALFSLLISRMETYKMKIPWLMDDISQRIRHCSSARVLSAHTLIPRTHMIWSFDFAFIFLCFVFVAQCWRMLELVHQISSLLPYFIPMFFPTCFFFVYLIVWLKLLLGLQICL